jgi:hypothetical protein
MLQKKVGHPCFSSFTIKKALSETGIPKRKKTETVLHVSDEVDLEINAEKSKYTSMFISCHQMQNRITMYR